MKRYLLRHPGVARLGVILLMLIGWEIAARWFIDPMFISPPSRVLMALGSVFATPNVPAALRLTFFELAVAFALAVIIGVVLGLAVGLSKFGNKTFMPIVLLLYGIPQITILPIFILYFGIGPAAKIAFGVTHGMFPIIMAVVAGVQNIKPILLTSARSMVFCLVCCSPNSMSRRAALATSPACSRRISIRPSCSAWSASWRRWQSR